MFIVMFVIKPLQLNSHLVKTTGRSRAELFKSSNFQGFRYKTDIDPANHLEALEFRAMTKDEQFNDGQNLVNQDIADIQTKEFKESLERTMKE